VVNRYAYDPYGTTTETALAVAVANPWRCTGEYQDTQTGLYKIGLRYYQPDLGRWTQRDPLERTLNPVTPPEANTYNYVGCNPVNYTDPTGLCTGSFAAGATALGLGGISTGVGIVTATTTLAVVGTATGGVGLFIGAALLGNQYYEECIKG
jgi:RHS repeat-associated protein